MADINNSGTEEFDNQGQSSGFLVNSYSATNQFDNVGAADSYIEFDSAPWESPWRMLTGIGV